jgi:hypothetical protein
MALQLAFVILRAAAIKVEEIDLAEFPSTITAVRE